MKQWDKASSIWNTFTAGISVICMSSMGAALAVAGAGATGMAGMSAMSDTQTAPSASLLLARFFESIGLNILNQLPNEVAQPLLIALLVISVGVTYIAYRGHSRPGVLFLTLMSAIALYVSIYVWMSELVYFISLAGFTAAAIWGWVVARKPTKSLAS